MIRTGRIAWCRTDTRIFLFNERLIIQVFILGVSPVFFTYQFMHALCKSFCQPVGQCFCHNAVVVVIHRLKFGNQFITAYACSEGKAAKIIRDTGFFLCHKIR
ncbi:hypothetical protein D3C86_1575140 [compost metagenome]